MCILAISFKVKVIHSKWRICIQTSNAGTLEMPTKSDCRDRLCAADLACMTSWNLVRLVSKCGNSQSKSQMKEDSRAESRLLVGAIRIGKEIVSLLEERWSGRNVFSTLPLG